MKRRSSVNAYFVQRIPADVKARIAGCKLRIPVGNGVVEKTVTAGAQDIRFSLKTSDKTEVKERQAAAYLERVWQSLRETGDNGPIRLRQDQIVALAGELYATFMRAFEQEPGSPERWQRVRDRTMPRRKAVEPSRDRANSAIPTSKKMQISEVIRPIRSDTAPQRNRPEVLKQGARPAA